MATKAELKAEQNKITKVQAFDSSYFHGKGILKMMVLNFLVFQPMYRAFRNIGNTDYISLWKSKWLFDESIDTLAGSNNSLLPALNYIGTKAGI